MKFNRVVMLFFCLITFSTTAQTRSISTTAQTTPINEEKFVAIGGIEQWVTIHGNDSPKPVLLFLHGGPGSTMSQYDDAIYGDWKKDFILVQWDQRGAGRTFGKNVPDDYDENYWIENPLTVAQMTDDGIALAEYLIERLQKEKIILLGTSWGSILGTKMDKEHRYDGDDYSFVNFVGHKKMGIKAMNATVDFLEDGLEFAIPVYFIQGENDILTPPEITRAYFDKLRAPKKKYFLLLDAAHGHNQAVVDTQYKIAKDYIVPELR